MLHGVWILVFAALLTGLVEQIPMAALAGLLIVIGIQLVKMAHLRTARRTGDLWVYGVTVAGVVFLNLLEGVIIGLALAVVLLLWRVIHPKMRAEPVGSEDSGRWRVTVEGSCSFLSMPALTGLLAKVPEARTSPWNWRSTSSTTPCSRRSTTGSVTMSGTAERS